MDYKAQLGIIVDAVMKGQMDEAKAAFHSLSVAKTQDLVRVTEGDDSKEEAKKGKKDAKEEGDNKKSGLGGKGKMDKDDAEKEEASKGKKDAKEEGDNKKSGLGGKGKSDKDDAEKEDAKKGKKDADAEGDEFGKGKGKGFVPFQKKEKKD